MPITPAEHAALLRRLARETVPNVGRALLDVAKDGAKMARARTREIHKVDTGHFAEGWGGEMVKEGAAVTNRALHAPWVESGRPPGGMPPIVVLARWAERRLGLGGKEAWRAARAIAMKIAERGTKGAKVLDWLRPKLTKMVQKAVTEEIADAWKQR